MARNGKKKKVVFIGSSGVGKTSIVLRHERKEFTVDITPTLGANFVPTTISVGYPNPKKVSMDLWDTAGQDRFIDMMPMYLRRAEGAFIVFDVTQRETFDDLPKWVSTLDNIRELPNVVVIIIGNKTDLTNLRCVTRKEAEEFAERKGFRYVETSALMDQGITEALRAMAGMLVEQSEAIPPKSLMELENEAITLRRSDEEKKCC